MGEKKEETLYQRISKEKTLSIELDGYSLVVYNEVREYVKCKLSEWMQGKDTVDPQELVDAILEFGDDYFESLLEKEESITSPKSMCIRISAAFFASNLEKIIERILKGQDSLEKS